MVTQLNKGTRTARKVHHCGMCGRAIQVGERHHVSTNVWDGRVYDWRECVGCSRDQICSYVHDWSGGYYDEGVGFDNAAEWADEAVRWPQRWSAYRPNVPITTTERMAARNWLARAAGGEGE